MILPEHIHLVKEWHPTKNGKLRPEQVTSFSHKKVWWLGECGHEWNAAIAARSNGGKCPYCSGRRVLVGFNDLATTNSNLVEEWHPTKNIFSVREISAGSNKRAWWQCDKGHEWNSIIATRALQKKGCPYCSGSKVISGITDLQTINPSLAKEWHPTKNSNLSPKQVLPKSSKKVWWLGECGHEWEAYISNRTSGATCPYCSGHKKLKGFNDLLTTHPNLAKEWHPTKNGSLKPEQVSKGTDKKIWWLGECGHEWKSNLSVRSSQNNTCPVCLNRNILPNYNDIATTAPEIASQWHPTKNGSLTPEQVSKSSNKKVWWMCDKGHEWEANIYSREKAGCRKCTAGERNSKGEKDIKEFIQSLGLKVEQANYDIVDKGEIDLYIPEKKIAIEFNGLYWHTEKQGKDKNYHYNKWLQCKNQGIQLIHIWEDDWNNKKEIIKSSLKYKLGVYDEEKIYARKTKIIKMNNKQAQIFFKNNHIQGYASGSLYIGLEYNGNIESAMIIKKENDKKTFNIIRYATKIPVVGGFTKIISYLEKTYSFDEFVTFSDHTISDGSLYEKNGFIAVKDLKPDYMYLVGSERKHKFGYRLVKFKNDDNLLWEEGLSESQLAKLNNIERIWDAGKTKWVKTQN